MPLRSILVLTFCLLITTSDLYANSLQNPFTPKQLADGWDVGKAADAGFDAEELTALANDLAAKKYINVHALLIERNGKLVYEQYLSGTDQDWGTSIGSIDFDGSQLHDLRSISKSVTALLLGIALGEDHEQALSRPALDYLSAHRETAAPGFERVTLRQVLTMSAGFAWNEMDVPYWDSKNDELRLYYTRNPIQHVLAKPKLHEPGQRWYYNGGMTMLTGAAVEQVSAKPLLEFAEDFLFKPLGITDYRWHKSSLWPSGSMPAVASGLRLLPRDLAKIGSLMINHGKWQGMQIVPPKWIELSAQRYQSMERWNQKGIYGYGLHWWNGQFDQSGKTVSAVTGVGYGGQRLFTAVDTGLSVTVLAGNYGSGGPQTTWQSERIFERVLGALK